MLSFPGRATIALLGGGVSHAPLLSFLSGQGYRVALYDTKAPAAFSDLIASHPEINFHFGTGAMDMISEDILFRSPGIRPDRYGIPAAKKRGSLLTSESEQFLLHVPCPVIGVTGSSGKTTTASLIHALLQNSGAAAFLGGNIGIPLLAALPTLTPHHIAVTELSSFQLLGCTASPQVAVITNLSENHLDYHHGMEEYLLAKARIFQNPQCGKVILWADDPYTPHFASLVPQGKQICYFGFGKDETLSVSCHGGFLWRGKERLLSTEDIRLPGKHNLLNFMAAIAACGDLIDGATVRQVAQSFSGVPHRLQLVAQRNGIRFYNSSIDTTPSRTMVSLQALSADAGRIHILLGGYDKKLSFAPLIPTLSRYAKSITLTGDTASKIETALQNARCTVPCHRFEAFDEAVTHLCSMAAFGDVVLLSPACASYDAFPNYEKRGQRFCQIVDSLSLPKGGLHSLL